MPYNQLYHQDVEPHALWYRRVFTKEAAEWCQEYTYLSMAGAALIGAVVILLCLLPAAVLLLDGGAGTTARHLGTAGMVAYTANSLWHVAWRAAWGRARYYLEADPEEELELNYFLFAGLTLPGFLLVRLCDFVLPVRAASGH